MRILQVHNKYIEKGGEDTVVENERRLLQDNGHVVQLCEFDNKNLEELSKIALLGRTLFNRKAYRTLMEHLAIFEPDVVHIHNVFYEASPAIFWALRKKRVPSVMTIHNYRFGCVQGLLFRENQVCSLCLDKKSTLYGIKNKCFKASLAKSMQLSMVNLVHQFTLKYRNPVKKYIFLAEFTKDLLSSVLSIDSNNWSIKPNCVNDFGYAKKEERADFYLFVGRLNEQKGVKQLIEIFIKNKKKLELIGSGPLDAYVREMATKYPNIRPLGYANNAFIVDKLKKSKALIVPSLTYEGQPMTILEAFSTGTPVFAANIKNLDSLIVEGQNGYLFDPYDTDYACGLFDKFEQLTTDALYDFARKTYNEKYAPLSNYRHLMGIYEMVIN